MLAISNVLASLTETIIRFATHGIKSDPYVPGNYERLIQIYSRMRRYNDALKWARKLQGLYGPPINPRTLYFLKQNPITRFSLDIRRYNPAQENQQVIEELERELHTHNFEKH